MTRLTSRGLSLVETLVGLVVGLLVVLAVLLLTVRMSGSRAEMDRTHRQIENGRFAMLRLAEDLRHAGYYGDFSALPVPDAATLALAPCSTDAATLRSLVAVPVRPYPALASASLPGCIPSADFVAGTNVVALRFASPRATAPGSLDGSLMYLQSNVVDTLVARGNASPPLDTFTLTRPTDAATPAAAEIRRMIVRLYFISPCSRPAPGQASCTAAADEGSPIRTLKMVELDAVSGAPAFGPPRAIAEGIERFEIDWGIDTDGDGAPDVRKTCGTGAQACSAAELANLVTADLFVLARETEATPGFTDAKTYTLGLAGAVTPADNVRRRLYSTTARLNNMSMRRE